jgi:nitrate reductase cytochrome c-type subunit
MKPSGGMVSHIIDNGAIHVENNRALCCHAKLIRLA